MVQSLLVQNILAKFFAPACDYIDRRPSLCTVKFGSLALRHAYAQRRLLTRFSQRFSTHSTTRFSSNPY